MRNEFAVGAIAVTFITRPVASAGMVQLPFEPRTEIVCVSLPPMGVERLPTLSAPGRVSMMRHGTIGTNTARSPVSMDAEALINPPAPMDTAIAAPIAAQRERLVVFLTDMTSPFVVVETFEGIDPTRDDFEVGGGSDGRPDQSARPTMTKA